MPNLRGCRTVRAELGDSATPVLDPIDPQTSAPPPRPRTEEPARHVQVVDGLRGLAILLVLLFHYWQLSWWVIPIPGLPEQYNLEFVQVAGYLGVELFSFLSAFCLFYPHAKAMFGLGPVPTLKHFYYRRVIKILPSYLLFLWRKILATGCCCSCPPFPTTSTSGISPSVC